MPNSFQRTIIKGGTLVLPTRLALCDLLIEKGLIKTIGKEIPITKDDRLIKAGGKYILPGFIDIHNHGAAGFDFTLGQYDPLMAAFDHGKDAFKKGLEKALQLYLAKGITRVVLTTMAAPLETLESSAGMLKEFIDGETPLGRIVVGINLEGTFLKLAAYAGAQNPEFFYPPGKEIIDRLQGASGNRLKIVNVPPEHEEAGLSLIRYLKEQEIVIAGGHSGAVADQFDKAIGAGLSLGVHFLNGPSKSSTKPFHGGGAVEAMLQSERVSLELIPDAYHVHPAYVRDTIVRKGFDKVIFITDSMFANGLTELEAFELWGLKGTVSQNREYLQLEGKEDMLFGSVLASDRGFSNVLNWLLQPLEGIWHREHRALGFSEALLAVSQMYSSNPARQIGVFGAKPSGEAGTGSIETGKWADLLLAGVHQMERGWELEVEAVFLQGELPGQS